MKKYIAGYAKNSTDSSLGFAFDVEILEDYTIDDNTKLFLVTSRDINDKYWMVIVSLTGKDYRLTKKLLEAEAVTLFQSIKSMGYVP